MSSRLSHCRCDFEHSTTLSEVETLAGIYEESLDDKKRLVLEKYGEELDDPQSSSAMILQPAMLDWRLRMSLPRPQGLWQAGGAS